MNPTTEVYTLLNKCFEHFNKELFNNELPPVMLTLQRKRGAYGYFSPERFQVLGEELEEKSYSEIALNPSHFDLRGVKYALSTLLHEMVHHWQEEQGKPGKGTYHNKEWAEKMKELGLKPIGIKNGKPTGLETGYNCTHEIEEEGGFTDSFQRLDESEELFLLASIEADKPRRDRSKVKYVCYCEKPNKVWGKPGLNLICGDCSESFLED